MQKEVNKLISQAQKEAKKITRNTQPDKAYANLITEVARFNSECYRKIAIRNDQNVSYYLIGVDVNIPTRKLWIDTSVSIYLSRDLESCGGILWPIADFITRFHDIPEEVYDWLYRIEVLRRCLDQYRDVFERWQEKYTDSAKIISSLADDLKKYVGEEFPESKGNLLVFRDNVHSVLSNPLYNRLENVVLEESTVYLRWYSLYPPRLYWKCKPASALKLYHLNEEMLTILAKLKVLTDLTMSPSPEGA